jgi:hypothetical protein
LARFLTEGAEEDFLLSQMTTEVDESFAMLISLSDADQERVKLAIETIQKMLFNLYNNKRELKFRYEL